MKAVIFNSNNALVLDISEAKTEENGALMEVKLNGATITTSTKNTIVLEGNDEVVNEIVSSLVGEGGLITYYDVPNKEKKVYTKENGKEKKIYTKNLKKD